MHDSEQRSDDPDFLNELIREGYEREAVLQRRVDAANAEVERLREVVLTVVEQVESCCSRSGLCIDVDRVQAEALRGGPVGGPDA